MNNGGRSSTDSIDATIGALFFLSGATSLAYQTLWFRRFTTTWGSSTLAMAAVVTSFLIGLAVGAYLFGRLARRVSDKIKCYGLLEIAIGVWALLVPLFIYSVLAIPADSLVNLSNHPVGLFAARACIAFLVIGPACVCMGGTLPVLVAFYARRSGAAARETGWLYGINTVGAAVGCYLTGFHLLPALGSAVTNSVMAASNIAIGVIAVAVSRLLAPAISDRPAVESSLAPTLKNAQPGTTTPILVFVASGLTGGAALILEMVWTRQLAVTLGGSTYTFTAALCIVLLGIGIGGLLYQYVGWFSTDHGSRAQANVLTILVLCSVVVVGQLAIPGLCLLAGALKVFRESMLLNGIICSAVSVVLELIPAIGMGVLFPGLVQAAQRGTVQASNVVGTLYLWNTVGAALGAVLTFSLFVPLGGISSAVAIAFVAYFAAAVLLEIDAAAFSLRGFSFTLIYGGALIVMLKATASPLVTNYGMYLYGPTLTLEARGKVVYFKEGISSNVLVTESVDRSRVLRVNGKVDASTGIDQNTQLGSAYFPRFLRPHATSVCIIGLGSGTTAGASLLFSNTEVTCFELEPAVYEASRHFAAINHSPWTSSHFNIVFDDGRSAVHRSASTYDLIISEPSNPWIAGVSNLYTVEFYTTALEHLNSNGILAQWMQNYSFTRNEFSLILRTMQRVFPHVALLRINTSDVILLASVAELCPSADDLDAAQESVDSISEVQKDLETYFGHTDVRSLLLHHFVLDEAGVSRLQLADTETFLNTDTNMRLEFDAPRQLFRTQIPDDVNVAVAIERSMRTDWYERCVERWQCSQKNAAALMNLMESVMLSNDKKEIQRALELYRNLDPEGQYGGVLQRICGLANDDAPTANDGKTLSRDLANSVGRIGVGFWQQQQYQKAVTTFQELVSMFPQSPTAWGNLATNYRALRQDDDASDAAQKAIMLDPFIEPIQIQRVDFKETTLHKTEQPAEGLADPDCEADGPS